MLAHEVYAARRQRYMEAMGANAVAVLHSPPELRRNGDAHYKFRQSSDVYYLSGFAEPGTTLVLRTGSDEPFVMFVRPRDPAKETWDGRRAGTEGAKADFGADVAYPAEELRRRLPELIANATDLYYAVGDNPGFDHTLLRVLASLRQGERRGPRPPARIVDPMRLLHEHRLFKSEAELEVLRNAADITCEAHKAAMALAQPGVGEFELEAVVDYTFRRRGGNGPGYSTIVGAGANATILHYIENSASLADGDLVLIDAGCELDFYTADVTRTFPANGTFSPAQRQCYDIVLAAQQRAIEMTRPGVTIDDIHHECVRILTEGMVELGLLEGPADARIADDSYKQFYMHRTSHWLGLDVHDVGAYNRDGSPRPLEPGMVITIEPGLYIADNAAAPEHLRGIGIRIEDDILVTADGHDNLTAAVPKTADAVEAACRA